ncbi:ATP-binding protein [Breoghania sp.]|uniref:ATP-binding protein n=1 Tax=Breoghania sp. TaxID=2065378 RepID=UPI002AA71B14|nr:ATP-binding protein [Breoghania sp.]
MGQVHSTVERAVSGQAGLTDPADATGVEGAVRRAVQLLARGVAHDVNNALLAVQLYADVISRQVEDEAVRRDCGEILSAVKRAGDITRALQVVAGHVPASEQGFDARELLAELRPALEAALGPGVDLKFVTEGEAGSAAGGRDRIEGALLGLCREARARMAAGGTMTIATEAVTVVDGGPVPPADYVCISLSDDGPQLPGGDVFRLFDPYFASMRFQAGNGLALAVCRALVEAVGGHVLAQGGAGGHGLCIALYLPRQDEAWGQLQPGAQGDAGGTE